VRRVISARCSLSRLVPILEQHFERDGTRTDSSGAFQVGRIHRVEARDRASAGGGELFQRRRYGLGVVVPLAGERGTVDVGKLLKAFAQEPDDAHLVSFDIDVAQMEEVLAERKPIRRGLEGQLPPRSVLR
jgi:hypothetical protein